MPIYSVSCLGDLSGGAITQLDEKGLYRFAEHEAGFARSGALTRHYLEVEAGSPEDAILVARGALAVAGAEARDYQADEGPPERESPPES
jgi:hypothetical protein